MDFEQWEKEKVKWNNVYASEHKQLTYNTISFSLFLHASSMFCLLVFGDDAYAQEITASVDGWVHMRDDGKFVGSSAGIRCDLKTWLLHHFRLIVVQKHFSSYWNVGISTWPCKIGIIHVQQKSRRHIIIGSIWDILCNSTCLRDKTGAGS